MASAHTPHREPALNLYAAVRAGDGRKQSHRKVIAETARYLGAASIFVVCPEHAELFRAAGWSKQRVREEMFSAVRRPAHELRWGETTPLVENAPDDEVITKWSSPSDVVLLVGGGEAGRYSAVFGPCLGMNERVSSKEVVWSM